MEIATLKMPCGSMYRRNALSTPATAASEIPPARNVLMSALKLISPSPSATGMISRNTRLIRSSRQSNAQAKWKPTRRSIGSAMPSCTIVPISTPTA